MNWRVDLKSQSRHDDQINTPVAIVEMELGKNGQNGSSLRHLITFKSIHSSQPTSWTGTEADDVYQVLEVLC
ncbi:UNVERIFIED_CONTAM: hypothetical protein H355_010403 [Colinus virginianus]|nr:hypothetical protein H355_010403 [Colinus virginianus]